MKNISYITDSAGVKTSVVIPVEEWEKLSQYLQELSVLEDFGDELKQSVRQAKRLFAGTEQQSSSTQDFLGAL